MLTAKYYKVCKPYSIFQLSRLNVWGVLKTSRPTRRHRVRPCLVLHVLFVTVAACSVFLGNETGFRQTMTVEAAQVLTGKQNSKK